MGSKALIDRKGLDALLQALRGRGYRVVGPTLRDRAIVYDDIAGVADLPAGWTDHQDGGTYRLARRDDAALFGYAATPQAWKRFLHPPTASLVAGHAARRRLYRYGAGADPAKAGADRRALLRPARDRDPGPGAARRRLCRPRLPGATRRHLRRRGQLRHGGRHLLLRVDADGAAGRRRLRSCTDRTDRRRAASLSGRGRVGGRSSAARRCPHQPGERGGRGGSRCGRRPYRGADGPPDAGERRGAGPAEAQPRSPALGRCRRALPDLRQLHDGVPDLLLHHGRGCDRRSTAPRASGCSAGIPALRWISPTCTAAACDRRRGRAIASG